LTARPVAGLRVWVGFIASPGGMSRDENRFDALAVAVSGSGTSRRQALKALAGAAIGGLLAQFRLDRAAAGDCRPLDSACGPSLSKRHGRPAPCCSHFCYHGVCDCPPGKSRCGGVCIGPDDVCADCLGLDAPCDSSGQCCDALICRGSEAGNVCACGDGQVACEGRCVDTATDPANCGACGNPCAEGQVCVNGGCCLGAGRGCDNDGCCSGTCCAGICCPDGDVCALTPRGQTECCRPAGRRCGDDCIPPGDSGSACAGAHFCSGRCVDGLCA
jgi:hypothetical protein